MSKKSKIVICHLLALIILSGCMLKTKESLTIIQNNSAKDLFAVIDTGSDTSKGILSFYLDDVTKVSVDVIKINGATYLTSVPDTLVDRTSKFDPYPKRIIDLKKYPTLATPYESSPRYMKVSIPTESEFTIGKKKYSRKDRKDPPPFYWQQVKLYSNDSLISTIDEFTIKNTITKLDTNVVFLGRYPYKKEFRSVIEMDVE